MSSTIARPVTWSGLLADLAAGRHLTPAEATWAMHEIMLGHASTARIAGLVMALRVKGATAAEIAGFVAALRASAVRIEVPGPVVDIAGTGGDRTGAVNISTMAAVVAAACGVTVVKHGGRSASSTTGGAADLVEQLGVPLDLSATEVATVASRTGITFAFGPRFNPGLRHAVDARRELGVPTVFNLLAPLVNPADPSRQVVGVSDAPMAPVVADVLAIRGVGGLVVRGRDGLDKLTTTAPEDAWVVRDGEVTPTVLDARDLGLARVDPRLLRGTTAADNAHIVRAVLDGELGPVRDVVLLNAAAVLVASDGGPAPLVEQLASALVRCAAAVDAGVARGVLETLVATSRQMVADRTG